ncbi:MAG TPA: hypothetical protein VHK27_08130, partial [Gammaproteobacteria bacterium]|nr:hypothetical protein [Gammaproteobacteria bacterium]
GIAGLTANNITAAEPATWDGATASIGVDVSEIDVSQTVGNLPVSRVPDAVPTSLVGVPGGVATLGGDGKVPASELSISGGFTFLGAWNASTNTPTLADGTGSTGDLYQVSVAGTQDLGSGAIDFAVGDHAIYVGTAWENFGSSEALASKVSKIGDTMSGVLILSTGARFNDGTAANPSISFTSDPTTGIHYQNTNAGDPRISQSISGSEVAFINTEGLFLAEGKNINTFDTVNAGNGFSTNAEGTLSFAARTDVTSPVAGDLKFTGPGGSAVFRSNNNAIEMRNDSGPAVVRGASPVGNNDFTTKEYVDDAVTGKVTAGGGTTFTVWAPIGAGDPVPPGAVDGDVILRRTT